MRVALSAASQCQTNARAGSQGRAPGAAQGTAGFPPATGGFLASTKGGSLQSQLPEGLLLFPPVPEPGLGFAVQLGEDGGAEPALGRAVGAHRGAGTSQGTLEISLNSH